MGAVEKAPKFAPLLRPFKVAGGKGWVFDFDPENPTLRTIKFSQSVKDMPVHMVRAPRERERVTSPPHRAGHAFPPRRVVAHGAQQPPRTLF